LQKWPSRKQLKTEIGRAIVAAPVGGVVFQVKVRPSERLSELDSRALMVATFARFERPPASRYDSVRIRSLPLLVETIVVGLAVAYAVANFIKGGEFVCRIDETYIQCQSPVRGCGPTFKIPIADIVKLEKQVVEDSAGWWDICVRSGKRFQLTNYYGLPAEKVALLLQDIKYTSAMRS
jgi:hypothetical protein